MTQVYLIRHATTDWMEREILHGTSDRPLSEFGLQQAHATADFLKGIHFDRLYTSPLLRAKQTAEKISQVANIEPIEVDDLKEEYYGVLEGRRDWWLRVKTKPVLIPLHTSSRVVISALTGEPIWAFRRRVERAWKAIKAENPSGTIGVVAHSGVLRCILRHELGGSHLNKKFILSACSVSQIEVDGHKHARLVMLNQNDHLPGNNSL